MSSMTSPRTHAMLPRVRPLPHTFVPIRASMIGTRVARTEYVNAMSALVETLAAARDLASRGEQARLRDLLDRAGRELDAADEKLLMLDRRRHRSMFVGSERLRSRLHQLCHLHDRIE